MKLKRFISLILVVCMLVPMFTSCSSQSKEAMSKKIAGLEEMKYAGTMGDIVTDYNGFLGYGYNVAKSAYFNSKDVSSNAGILDMDKLVKDRLVSKLKSSDTKVTYYSGSTLQSYQEDVSREVSLSFSYGLFSKIKGDFNLKQSMTKSSLSKNVYIKNQVVIQRERQIIDTSKVDNETLKKYIYPAVSTALNKDTSKMSPVDKETYYNNFFDRYGTHIMTDIMLGGRMDLNYVYTNKQSKSIETIEAEAQATYKTISTKVNTDISETIKKQAQSFTESTTFLASRIGGSVAGDITTYDQAKATFGGWATSINDMNSLELIDVGSNCADSLIGFWSLADNQETQKEIAIAYQRYVDSYGGFFKSLDAKLDETDIQYYVKNIYIGSANTPNLAKSDIDKQVAANEPNALKKTIVEWDLNKNAGGNYIYIGYTMTENPSEALRDIKVQGFDDSNSHNLNNFTKINSDLNANAGGEWIWLYYSKVGNGAPLTDIGVEIDGTFSFGSASNGWVASGTFSSQNSGYDCNKGCGSKTSYIYVWYKR